MEQFKIIFIVALAIFFCLDASAQQYTPMTAAGYQMKRLKADSTLHIPSFCGIPTLRNSTAKDGAIAMDTCNNKLYKWTNQAGWSEITGGGGTTQDLASVLGVGNKGYKNIELYTTDGSDNVATISPIDNDGRPLLILIDSIGKSIQLTTNSKTENPAILFGDGTKYQSLEYMPNSEGIVWMPIQNNIISTIDTLATLRNIRQSAYYFDSTSLSNRINLKLNISDTSAMLSPYMKKVDTTTMLSHYFNNTNYGLSKSGQTISVDTTTLSGKYLRIVDTANRWINNITRTIGKDSIIFYKDGNRYAIKDSIGTNPPASGYYGAFQDNTSQTAASINTAYAVKLNTTDLTNGVSVVNDGSSNPTRVTLANTGIYNIQFSLQLEKTGGSGNMIADIWIRKNGVDIPSTTGKVVLTGSANASPVIAAWNYVLDLTAGDYIQLMWATSNINVAIIAAVATSPHPAIPSAILTVTQQAGILAGTGITAINSLTGAAQTMLTGTDSSDFKIVSTGTSHTFNLPSASATKRGALSSTDWTTFNNKVNISDTATMLTNYPRGTGSTNRLAFWTASRTLSSNANLTVDPTIPNILVSSTNIRSYITPTAIGHGAIGSGIDAYAQLNTDASNIPRVFVHDGNNSQEAILNANKLSFTTTSSGTLSIVAPAPINSNRTINIQDASGTLMLQGDTISLSNRVNLKSNLSQGTYSFLANNSNATANMASTPFKDVSGSYTGTPTWTGTAPTGLANATYQYTQIGKQVTLRIYLQYTSAGISDTRVQIPFIADFPTPIVPTGLTSTSDILYFGTGAFSNNKTTLAATIGTQLVYIRGTATSNEIVIDRGAGIGQYVWATIQYFTNTTY